MVITGNGNVGIGNAAPNTNAILDLTNTYQDKALLLPIVSATSSVTTPSAGFVVYDSTENEMFVYDGSSWIETSNNAIVSNEMIFDGRDDSITTNNDYIYVSLVVNGDWKVSRYSRANVNHENTATQANNNNQTTQPITLADCSGLNYQ